MDEPKEPKTDKVEEGASAFDVKAFKEEMLGAFKEILRLAPQGHREWPEEPKQGDNLANEAKLLVETELNKKNEENALQKVSEDYFAIVNEVKHNKEAYSSTTHTFIELLENKDIPLVLKSQQLKKQLSHEFFDNNPKYLTTGDKERFASFKESDALNSEDIEYFFRERGKMIEIHKEEMKVNDPRFLSFKAKSLYETNTTSKTIKWHNSFFENNIRMEA